MIREEIKVCEDLKHWFSQNNIQCWLNEGSNKFQVKGSRKRPDLIIYSKKLNQYIAIEVKIGDVSREVYNATKILHSYYQEYVLGKATYHINEEKINISSFVVCTKYSQLGKLFEDDQEYDVPTDDWNKTNKFFQIEPIHEYKKSRQYLRQLWSSWRLIREPKTPGIGIILSNVLNEGRDSPLLFDQQWEGKWKVKQKDL